MDFNLTASEGIIFSAIISVISSLVGAVIGGWMTRNATINATNMANEHQQKLIKDADEAILTGFIWSIHDEMKSLYSRYNETAGALLRNTPQNQMLAIKYRVDHDYFSVYHSNSSLIGKVSDHELRSDIINAYTIAKSILDSYSIHWDLMTKYEDLCRANAIEPSPVNAHYVQAYQHHLIEYTIALKGVDDLLCSSVERLLERINTLYVR
ncbi:hypothetical protein [Aeromonas hydrophila]|uniref:hypothetical protein n=1 Tax=Aeromonas hydrophila TaxID=644 RepID=UPI0036702851